MRTFHEDIYTFILSRWILLWIRQKS